MTDKGTWTPDSWRQFPIKQQPVYQDQELLQDTLKAIQQLPPLVFAGEIESLKKNLAQAAKGGFFLLQGGDCAERFIDCQQMAITKKLKILLQMSVIIAYGAKKPVIRIGRIGGQYAKPRSSDTEVVNGQTLPSYRGDIINSFSPVAADRQPNPNRLLESYFRSALTINYIRALTTGGFADLHHPNHWDLEFVLKSQHREQYEQFIDRIQDAIAFIESIDAKSSTLDRVEFFTSHEGLLLGYESAQTRFVPELGGYYNLGAHMLWIGDRTRDIDGAHVEYFRGIKNPIGIKVGPSSQPEDIISLLDCLNPTNEPGKIVLITRFGHHRVNQHLPKIAEAIKKSTRSVVWSVDPMHGNAIKSKNGIKTRDFNSILTELRDTHTIHNKEGTLLSGVHFELTGENVTECTGGSTGLTEEDLQTNYETYCDPRLNYNQSLEIAFLIAKMLKNTT